MNKLLPLAFLLLVLAGCAGSNYDIAVRQGRLADYAGADAGWVVASAGGEHGHFDSAGITFQRAGTDDLVSFGAALRATFSTPAHDFESGSTIGLVHVRRLPPGDYVAAWAQGAQNANNSSVRKPLPPQLHFTVKTGETTYLGRYVIGESRFTPIVIVSDHQDEDLAIARTKQAALPTDAVAVQVPPPSQRRF